MVTNRQLMERLRFMEEKLNLLLSLSVPKNNKFGMIKTTPTRKQKDNLTSQGTIANRFGISYRLITQTANILGIKGVYGKGHQRRYTDEEVRQIIKHLQK